jgi:hypothetical protein
MAAREGGGHPFNWFIIGFVCGVIATVAAMIYLGVRKERRPDDIDTRPPEAAASAARAAIPALPAAPPPAVKKPVEPIHDRPQASQHELDEQMAEDAAAAGMTSRTRPGQGSPDPQ